MAALDVLVRQAERIPEVEAVVLIGSLASGRADAVSDVDAIVIARDASFAAVYRQRHNLHGASVLACWDQRTDPGADVAAHKWIDANGVLLGDPRLELLKIVTQ